VTAGIPRAHEPLSPPINSCQPMRLAIGLMFANVHRGDDGSDGEASAVFRPRARLPFRFLDTVRHKSLSCRMRHRRGTFPQPWGQPTAAGTHPVFGVCTKFCGPGFQPVKNRGQEGRVPWRATRFRTVPVFVFAQSSLATSTSLANTIRAFNEQPDRTYVA
jgi:hypothetical protein